MNRKTLKNGFAWLFSALLGLSFLAAGWPKIMPSDSMINRFENWGYSEGFTILIGVLEFLAGAVVLIPRTATYGAVLIVVLMVGAIYTHISTQIGSPLFALVYLVMAMALSVMRYPDAYLTRV